MRHALLIFVGAVKRENVQHGYVRPGNQSDQSDDDDGHVFGDGPPAHARGPFPRAIFRLRSSSVQPHFAAVTAFRVRAVQRGVAVLPKRGQMDGGRTQKAQDGEENGPEQ